ncbi:MAG: hypothetical protein PHP11_03915 [Erysipelotrichaceae bacterium]|nr:hypothetical protein [Erysipelotrichaceae bacterium]MDD3924230.1 hypothetical protein [Erysipelotrichaceae bacterium]
MNKTRKALINAILLILTLIINALGAIGWLNGLSQKAVSDMYPTLITPSPFTFSIWGVVYSFLILSIIMMLLRNNDPYYQKAVDRISILFWISCIFNIAWIIAFSYVLLELSLVLIFGFTIVMALICTQLALINDKHRFLLPITFSLYTGWLFIATVVNTAATLVKIQWQGFNIPIMIWSIIALIVAIIIVLLVNTQLKNAVFPLPIAWAYFGIYQNLSTLSLSNDYQLLKITALIGMAILIGIAAIQLYKNQFSIIANDSIY